MNYREVIESKYDRAKWQVLLHDIFGSKAKFWNTASNVSTNSQFAQQALWLGTITLSDEQTIAVYEVELAESVDIERNRRGIRDMLLTDWRAKGCAGAFMFCYRKNESVLRFSYVSESWKFAEDGTYQKESTDTKRFTYLLGEGHRSRTAIQQFETLKKSDLKLKDLTKAFSVDAVSDMFFAGYKKQYEDIIQYVTGKRMVKVSNKWEERVVGEPCEKIMQEFAHFTNPEKSIRDYVKKLMGCLVFLQFLQKKGWLGVPVDGWWGDGDPEFLQTLFAQYDDKELFVDNVLEPLFNDLNNEREGDISQLTVLGCQFKVPYLNGGLFEREATDQTSFPLPAKYMQNMLDFFSSYNFTIDENDPDDAEVGVDPEMLGRIFENLLEDNKDKGAFYTPKEIVSYMCRESLIAYLQTDIDDEPVKEAIREFVTTHNAALLCDKMESVDQRLKDVKICDPAIGSGAFPMGLLKELFQCRTAIEGIDQHQAAEIKKHIIQQNIYGVDIERGAVDIARLRFWLALIVDEDEPHALPNLDYKIMQGNSLVSTFCDEYINLDTKEQNHANSERMRQTKRTLHDLKRRFYDASGTKKNELLVAIKDNILQLISLQLGYELRVWAEQNAQTSLFPSPQQLSIKTIIQQLPPERQRIVQRGEELRAQLHDESLSLEQRAQTDIRFFDYRIMFTEVFDTENPGFDIVIGNPPYVEAKKLKYIASTLKNIFGVYSGTADLSIYFIEQGLNILSTNGILSFITTNKFFNTGYGKKLRELITSNSIRKVINFEQVEVFEDILVSSVIIEIAKKCANKGNSFYYEKFYKLKKEQFIPEFLSKQDVFGSYSQDYLDEREWSFSDMTELVLKSKIESDSQPLSEIKGISINRGVTTGYNPAFIISDEKKEELINEDASNRSIIKNMLQGRNIRKWFYNESDENLLQTGFDIDIQNDYYTIYDHLLSYKDELIVRADQGKNWWNLRACKYYPEFERCEKIIWGLTADKWAFTIDKAQHYLPSNGYILTSTEIPIRYVLGILNSKLMHYYFHFIGIMTAGGAYTLKAATISALPFKIADDTSQLSSIVENILSIKEKDHNADVSELEHEIDQLVYALYDLAPEEIAIIQETIKTN